MRDLLCRGLATRGYHVLAAANGEDALSVADRHNAPIHLVISDVVMPEMNGLQLFQRLRAWFPAIRFLFISGYSRIFVTEGDLTDGRIAFLPKPFTVTHLAQEGRALLDVRPRITQPRLRAMALD